MMLSIMEFLEDHSPIESFRKVCVAYSERNFVSYPASTVVINTDTYSG